jgi:hypothetical protein
MAVAGDRHMQDWQLMDVDADAKRREDREAVGSG